MQSVDNLGAAAKIAYQAFLDMGSSKASHFSYLEAIETKYKFGGVPSSTEKLELEKLLANHNQNVFAFKSAMVDITDSDEKQTLIKLIS